MVDEQCEVEFHIGRDKDKVVCDIMPMDVCHILLGRPWQYDHKVVHDGKTNCYKFVKDGIKNTLVPIKEEETTETSGITSFSTRNEMQHFRKMVYYHHHRVETLLRPW